MTQVEKLLKEIDSIKKDITTQDKKDCCVKLNKHMNTIKMYLDGTGKDGDTAYDVLAFFKKCIDKRNKILA